MQPVRSVDCSVGELRVVPDGAVDLRLMHWRSPGVLNELTNQNAQGDAKAAHVG